MNEITRIHIAKTPYDIEVAAKKELEKYIKSLELYTQDSDVLADIEIRMTELLGERGIAAGGVIASDDVTAIRKQLGEPYEFADGDGDIAVGATSEQSGRRLYRNTDNAVLGGVLSGIASYFGVNPLWTRLIFVLIVFISFGFALFAYILLWVIIPPARTAAEKLQLVGSPVTLESIKGLNATEEMGRSNNVAPVLQQVFSIGLGILSLVAAVSIFVMTVWGVVEANTNNQFDHFVRNFGALGDGYGWLSWLLFWIVVFGSLLLAALFGLIAYAFLARKLTKRMIISGIVIIVLGVLSVGTVVAVGSTQSWRVSSEARSSVRTTQVNLPKEFANIHSVEVTNTNATAKNNDFSLTPDISIQYVVDSGTPHYELSALPNTKPSVKIDGETAHISINVPDDYRNMFVQPTLTIYGPALDSLSVGGAQVSYAATSQNSLNVTSKQSNSISLSGSYTDVTIVGTGSVDASSASIQTLNVQSDRGLSVTAGTVRDLTVTQPDVCPSGTYSDNTRVTVSNVTATTMTYNGKQLPAATYRTSCASVVFENENE